MTTSTAGLPGRTASVSFEQVVDAAEALADAKGLDAISFRALARALDVSAMAVHRTTGGIDTLLHAVVSRSVVEAVRGIRWPDEWPPTVELFADALRSLLLRHPAVLQAHQRAPLAAQQGNEAAEVMLASLTRAGLSPIDAVHAYVAIHDYVTGHVALQLSRGDHVSLPEQLGPHQQASRDLFENPDYDRRFKAGLDLLVRGVASLAGSSM